MGIDAGVVVTTQITDEVKWIFALRQIYKRFHKEPYFYANNMYNCRWYDSLNEQFRMPKHMCPRDIGAAIMESELIKKLNKGTIIDENIFYIIGSYAHASFMNLNEHFDPNGDILELSEYYCNFLGPNTDNFHWWQTIESKEQLFQIIDNDNIKYASKAEKEQAKMKLVKVYEIESDPFAWLRATTPPYAFIFMSGESPSLPLFGRHFKNFTSKVSIRKDGAQTENIIKEVAQILKKIFPNNVAYWTEYNELSMERIRNIRLHKSPVQIETGRIFYARLSAHKDPREMTKCANIDCHTLHTNDGPQTLKELKRCSNCKIVKYCSKKCQIYDWKQHKRLCKLSLN